MRWPAPILPFLLLTLPLAGQGSGTFPAEPFNGLQVTYSVSGAEVTGSADAGGFTNSRRMVGRLSGRELRVSGTAGGREPQCNTWAGSFWNHVTVEVWAGDQRRSFAAPQPNTCATGQKTYSFDVALPVPEGVTKGGFSIHLNWVNPRFGDRGLIVRGEFGTGATLPAGTTTPSTPPPPSQAALWTKLMNKFSTEIPKGLVGGGRTNNVLSLWDDKYSEFVCGGYQAKVLAWLDKLRNSSNPEERALVEGYDYGPIEAYNGYHQAVVLWPKGKTWTDDGIVLDPWPEQKPKSYSIQEWASIFSWDSMHGIRGSHVYTAYPTTGHAYPPEGGPGLSHEERAWVRGLPPHLQAKARKLSPEHYNHWVKQGFAKRERNATLIAHCPVEVAFGDAQGRVTGFVNGRLRQEIPEVLAFRQKQPDGTWWYQFDYPTDNAFAVAVSGTGAGQARIYTATKLDRTPTRKTVERFDLPVQKGRVFKLAQPGSANPMVSGGEEVLPVRATAKDAR